MKYERPVVSDFGSIGRHTFDVSDPPPRKDTALCTKDPQHSDESCPTP
jgi:hypothetical protein